MWLYRVCKLVSACSVFTEGNMQTNMFFYANFPNMFGILVEFKIEFCGF